MLNRCRKADKTVCPECVYTKATDLQGTAQRQRAKKHPVVLFCFFNSFEKQKVRNRNRMREFNKTTVAHSSHPASPLLSPCQSHLPLPAPISGGTSSHCFWAHSGIW